MYYELIKMLIAYESQPGHDSNSRELSGRLQKYLNQRFLEDVEVLKKRTTTTTTTNVTKEPFKCNEVNGNIESHGNMINIEERLNRLEQEQMKLRRENKELKEANSFLLMKIKPLVECNPDQEMKQRLSELDQIVKNIVQEQKLFNKLQLENNKHTDNQLLSQTDILKIMKERLDKHDEELSLIIQSEEEQNQAIDKMKHFKHQIEAHEESAELFSNLQSYLSSHEEPGLEEILQNIMELNKENRKLISKLESKDKTSSSDDAILNLQNQLESLKLQFEELKSKDEAIGREEDTRFINSEKYLADMNNMIMSVKECHEKLTNFENAKNDGENLHAKNLILDDKMSRLIDQVNTLMIKIIPLEEKIKKLEYSDREILSKMSNLEAADIFLQEADRMIIEKVSKIDTDMRKNNDIRDYVDETILRVSKKVDQKYNEVNEQLLQHQRDVKTEAEKLLEKIDNLSKERNDGTSVNNNVQKLQHNNGQIDNLQHHGHGHQSKIAFMKEPTNFNVEVLSELYRAFSKFDTL